MLYLSNGVAIKNEFLSFFFRFAGEEFPPRIVFKVFIQTDGYGVKYLCGRKVIKPASQVQ